MGAVLKYVFQCNFSENVVKRIFKSNIHYTHYFESSLINLYFWKENEEGIRIA